MSFYGQLPSRAAVRCFLIPAFVFCCASTAAEEPGDPASAEERLLDVYTEWLSERVEQTVDQTAAWLDSRFGNLHPRYRESTFGYVRVVPLWVEHHGWEYDTVFRARVDLPNLHRRLHAAFGAGDEENFVTNRPVLAGVEELSLAKNRFDDRSFLAGLGYSLKETRRSSLGLGAGIKIRSSLQPYVRARYVRAMPLGSTGFIRIHETLYVRKDRGEGSVTGVDYERVLAPRLLARGSAFAHFSTWDERPQEFGAEVSLARAIDRVQVLALTSFASYEPKSDVELQDYGARIIYRRLLSRHRLYGELHLGYSWPRYSLEDERRASLNLGFGVELHFGDRRAPLGRDFGNAE